MWIFYYIFLLLLFSFLMVKSTHLVVGSLRSLVAATGVSAYGLASFVLAFSTSLPEISIAVSAGIHGKSALALGNVLGSNIANISLVLGLAALVGGGLAAYDNFLSKDIFYAFIAGTMPLLLLVDGNLSRVEGFLLIVVYVLYNLTVISRNREELAEHEAHELPLFRRLWMRVVHPDFYSGFGKLLVGGVGLIVAAELMVKAAVEMAMYVELPLIVVGLFVVAVGTSLPELAFELVAIREGDAQMAFGNILGSIVANSTLIIGLSALLSPIILEGGSDYYWFSSLAFVIMFVVFFVFVWTHKTLERIEGGALVMLYLLFVYLQLL